MNKSKFGAYAEIKNSIALLEDKLDELKPEILAEFEKAGVEQVESEWGKFILEKKRTWKFSEHVEKAKSQVKELETEEKAKGEASYTETAYVKFYSNKE